MTLGVAVAPLPRPLGKLREASLGVSLRGPLGGGGVRRLPNSTSFKEPSDVTLRVTSRRCQRLLSLSTSRSAGCCSSTKHSPCHAAAGPSSKCDPGRAPESPCAARAFSWICRGLLPAPSWGGLLERPRDRSHPDTVCAPADRVAPLSRDRTIRPLAEAPEIHPSDRRHGIEVRREGEPRCAASLFARSILDSEPDTPMHVKEVPPAAGSASMVRRERPLDLNDIHYGN